MAGEAQAVVGQLSVGPSMLSGGPFETPPVVSIPGDVDLLGPGVTQLGELVVGVMVIGRVVMVLGVGLVGPEVGPAEMVVTVVVVGEGKMMTVVVVVV